MSRDWCDTCHLDGICGCAPADGRCYWCDEPAEHTCADCECDLCPDHLEADGCCPGCQPFSEEEIAAIREAGLAEAVVELLGPDDERTAVLLPPDPITGREVAA